MSVPANRALRLRMRRAARRGSVLLLIVVLLVLAIGVGALVWFYVRGGGEAPIENVIVRPVFRGPYEHIVLEQGQVESSGSVEIRCEVKSRSGGGTEVLWVIDEGSLVKGGEKLVQLDSSSLEQEQVQQQIVCSTSEALVIQAENTLSAAKISRTEYLEGTFKQEEQVILSEIFVAEENLRRAQLAAQSTERLAAKGIVTALQLEGDQFAVEKAKNELDSAKTKLEVIRKYTKEKMLKQFDSDIATAEAKWSAEKESYQLELEKLADIKQQIANCTIIAPEDGQVVYANVYSRRGGSAEFVLEPGASIRERQVLIRLPDPGKMQVKATINESRISLVRAGMPVEISLDAVQDRKLVGSVTKVNQYAEPGSWSSGNIKEYAAFIAINNPPDQIRSGMNAEVRIFVESREAALQVPVQALYETKGHFFCLLKKGQQWETREVQVGSSNDSFMTIESGLEQGEPVVMNPRAHIDHMEIPDLPDLDPELLVEDAAAAPGGPPVRGPDVSGGGDSQGPSAGGGPPGGFDPSRIFAMLDQDGDGTISSGELAQIPADRRQRMAASDADGDGAITLQEFTAGVAARGGRPPAAGNASNDARGGGEANE